ncbi:hypothetical protein RISK_002695 [Rhodopirellula islandica]|uniref:Uncharacterized protein n=1 Tax=Rhodopirellula islandica TaxID=595434 RepID=A0A0J1EI33_RHOIS|nr:hypothetical protein RISK_002695 [Rhodopirellula islandica]
MQIGISQRDPKFTLDEKTYIAAATGGERRDGGSIEKVKL